MPPQAEQHHFRPSRSPPRVVRQTGRGLALALARATDRGDGDSGTGRGLMVWGRRRLCGGRQTTVDGAASGSDWDTARRADTWAREIDCMEGILERYQRYSFEERAVLDPNIGDQANWGDEYGRLKTKLDALQKSQRQLLGEQLDSLTIKELQQLEQQLDSSLKHIRSRKNQLMFDSISELQKKEKSLTDQNGVLQKVELMEAEKEKNNTLMNAHLREQQNGASSNLPSPSPSTVPDSMPTLNIGPCQLRGGAVGESEPEPSPAQVNSGKLPPWMLRSVSNS
ncbi:MADS-box transcription factor 18-like [Panicum miliaceum]|uniref:MADS-box transcription factor 18-like n=1 Tax=Panicum miliaceum TaxID=4540 RepID=A0A3L6QSD2_PANMI|nr:MADS-box transcription factor 18-like [Panicum miliaceum]